MHERGMIKDIMRRAGNIAERNGGRLSGISLRVGAASGITADAARLHAEAVAEQWWGFSPDLEIEESSDPSEPGSGGVSLVKIRVEE